ncbi:PilN domain-containing protein [Beggiatoa leptomitoformis]|uniref:Pilus assembly protein PilN n=1 Tax=Beggiatoa leptomitoformis TaxID=288004 RepID=A0A2N9YGW8_9GAMM|nr:PilN domain-containing protein [Beggiatoa leptomitoformis]AUI69768.1 pilus assembly protein PilN [Beggiatoa leptomitoformis]QGX03682.1 pilus assembly protein PilN [Beggiatoa leptomitoformis]
MANINLLPWRETLKHERETRFFIILGISLAIAGLVVLGVHLYMEGEIDYQNSRNSYITSEIDIVKKQIEEIKELEAKKAVLIERMNVIQQLEASRPLSVRLMDEMVLRVPEGVYFTNMTQKQDNLTIEGVAQSDARVSSLMRQLDSSPYLASPMVEFIENKDEKVVAGAQQARTPANATTKRTISSFKLTLKQETPKEEDPLMNSPDKPAQSSK